MMMMQPRVCHKAPEKMSGKGFNPIRIFSVGLGFLSLNVVQSAYDACQFE